MKYLKQLTIILTLTLIGECLNKLLPLPVPAGVYGLFILLICLKTGVIKLDAIEETGHFLLDIMPVMFVPSSVGIVLILADIKPLLVPLFLTTVLSTLLVMVVTGSITQFVIRSKAKRNSEKKGEEDK